MHWIWMLVLLLLEKVQTFIRKNFTEFVIAPWFTYYNSDILSGNDANTNRFIPILPMNFIYIINLFIAIIRKSVKSLRYGLKSTFFEVDGGGGGTVPNVPKR